MGRRSSRTATALSIVDVHDYLLRLPVRLFSLTISLYITRISRDGRHMDATSTSSISIISDGPLPQRIAPTQWNHRLNQRTQVHELISSSGLNILMAARSFSKLLKVSLRNKRLSLFYVDFVFRCHCQLHVLFNYWERKNKAGYTAIQSRTVGQEQ